MDDLTPLPTGLTARDGTQAKLSADARHLDIEDAKGRLIFRYDSDSGTLFLQAPTGDVHLAAPKGSISLEAAQGLNMAADRADVRANHWRQTAATYQVTADDMITSAGRWTHKVGRLVQRLGRAYTLIDGLCQIRAGRRRVLVDGDDRLTAGSVTAKARGDVSLDGKQIRLG